ncbi:ATP-dependent RNA helicase Ddx1-like isoform X2 [Artemia franciscana]
MGVLTEIAKRAEEVEWMLPTDVQAEAIPLILGGGDVLMAAETGSGKTGAFCLPVLQIVWESLKDILQGKGTKSGDKSDVPPFWGMSLFDRTEKLAVTPDGLRCQSRDFKEWHGGRGNRGVSGKGRYYYEATVCDEGLCRVGWATAEASLDLGTDKLGFGFGGTGKKSNSKQFDTYGEPFGMMDVIGLYLNLDDGEISFSKNGQDFGVAFKIPKPISINVFYPTICLKNAEIHVNFGDKPFKYPPKTGYIPISQAPSNNVITNQVVSSGPKETTPPKPNAPQAIIIEPSRELAIQTAKEIDSFSKYLENPRVRAMVAVGGIPVKDQIQSLQNGVDVVIATPGRLEELISQGCMSLSQVRFFILDEADGLLQQGHGDLVNRLYGKMPKVSSEGRRLQMIVCSATLHSFDVKKLAERLMHFPTWVDLKGQDSVPDTVHHVVVLVDPRKDKWWQNLRRRIRTDGVHAADNLNPNNLTPEMLSEAVKLLKGEYCIRAIDEHKMDQALIFCRTKQDCDNLEIFFKSVDGRGNPNPKYTCVCLHGDRKPQERAENLAKFKKREVKFLICTDVAARGLDITGLPFMINMTLPDEKSNYVHRIGRVGRAERMGLAISIVSAVPEKVWYHGEWCSSRGKNCSNTRLTDQRGCCIWYNELNCLAEIEDHLGVTVPQVGSDIKVPVDEFEGKVIYGQKRIGAGSGYQTHVGQLAPAVRDLAALESQTQILYLKRKHALKGR